MQSYLSGWTDGRTDTMCENNDHLFGRSLVGEKWNLLTCFKSRMPSSASCNNVTNLVVNKPKDFSNLEFSDPGNAKGSMMADS